MRESSWSQAPEGPLADVASALSDAAETACGDREGIRIIFTVSEENRSLTGFHGYDEGETAAALTADFIRQAERMLAPAGIAMEVVYLDEDGTENKFENHNAPLKESEPGQPRARLVIHQTEGRIAAPKICTAVKEALEACDAVASTQVVILLRTSDEYSTVMSHGYDDDMHRITHTLLNALLQFSEHDEGCMRIIPVALGGGPN